MKKTNYVDSRGKKRYRLQRKVGMRANAQGEWTSHVKSFYGSCKSEAEEKYIAYMRRMEKESLCRQYECLGEAIDAWVQNAFIQSDLANSTKKKYLGAYERIMRPHVISGQPLEKVTALALQNFYNSIEECYSTRRALHNFLGHFFRYAEINDLCGNVTRSLIVQKKRAVSTEFEIDVWDDDNLKRLITSLEGSLLRLLVVLAVNTGARFSELLALSYDDISDSMLRINKQVSDISPIGSGKSYVLHMEPVKSNSSNRLIPLAKEVMQEIGNHKKLQEADKQACGYDNKGLLFTSKNGTMLDKRNVSRALKRHYKREGLPYHKFHSFRHTFGTNLSRQGVSLEEIARLMGHSSIEMSAKYYIYVDALRQKNAVEKIVGYSL